MASRPSCSSSSGSLRSEEHTSELQSPCNLVCRLLLEKKKNKYCSSLAATFCLTSIPTFVFQTLRAPDMSEETGLTSSLPPLLHNVPSVSSVSPVYIAD